MCIINNYVFRRTFIHIFGMFNNIILFLSDFIREDYSEGGGGGMRALILQEFKISMIEGQGRYRSWQMVGILHFYCI